MSSQRTGFDTSAWNETVVKDYLTATSQQKDDPKKFYDTHLAIDKIYAEFLGGAHDDEFVTQEQFRNEILSGEVDNNIRTYILRGETGSGKSQLCQWLDYELQGLGEADDVEDRVPLHIKANETSLEQIISTLAEPLGIDPEVDQVTELDAAALAEGITSAIRANPGPKLRDVNLEILFDSDQGDLESLLESNIREYQKGLEDASETDFDPNLISNDDYRDLRLQFGTDSVFHKNKDVLRQALRDEIHRHFSHLIGVDDFQGQLREYSQRIVEEQNKRPVVICEDVTTFSVLKEQLLDQVIQVESATYDIVLGYTTGFEQDDLQDALGSRSSGAPLTYLKDRAEGYLSLTDDGEAYFLDDALSVELVRKYLDVIKEETSNPISDEIETGFDDLYPFNKAFIRRVYNHLQEEGEPRQTPRVLLQKVVRRCLLADVPPFETVEKSTNVSDLVPAINPAKYSERCQLIGTWYGVKDDDLEVVRVNERVIETFGVLDEADEVTEIDGTEYGHFEPNSAVQQILGPMMGGSASTGGESDGKTVEIVTTEGGESNKTIAKEGEGPESGSSQDAVSGDIDRSQQQLKDFYDWVKTGDEYESSSVLRSGAEDLLEMWYDPTRLANPNASTRGVEAIYYTRGQNVPVSIQGPDERDGLDVTLPFGEDYIELYIEILQLGMSGELSDEVNAERLRSWTTNEVVGFRNEIRSAIEECLPEGLSIEHCILLGKYFLLNAEFGATSFSQDDVFTDLDPGHREYENPISETLGRDHALDDVLEGLQLRRSDIDGLVEGFFLLKENLVDHARLNPARQDMVDAPEEYLRLAQEIDTQELDYPSAYEIGTNRGNANVEVTTWLDAISDFAVELELFTDDDLNEVFANSLNPVEKWYDSSHTADDIEDYFDRLTDCMGVFQEREREPWSRVYQNVRDNQSDLKLSEFERVVGDFLEPEPDSPFERVAILHSFTKSQNEHAAWEIYKTLDEMIVALDDHEVSASGDLKERIREIEELDEYESSRSSVISALESY